MCMGILLACLSVYNVHVWCPWRPEESISFPGAGVTDLAAFWVLET